MKLGLVFLMLFMALSTANAAPAIRVSPNEIVLGDQVEIELSGINPADPLQLNLDFTDGFGSTWHSEMKLGANELVAVRTGFFQLKDPHRLFWSAVRTKQNTSIKNDQAPNTAVEADLTLLTGNTSIAHVHFRQWIQRPGVTRTAARNGIVGSLYSPQKGSGVGILVIGGSGGGMTWSQQFAAELASKGHHAMGVAYFNAPGVPDQVDRIPLEYFRSAIDQLKATPGVDPNKIIVLGQSWGSQAALLLANVYPDIAGVIAYVPGSAAFQAINPPDYKPNSSWTYKGVDVPFVAMSLPDEFSEPDDPIERWMIVLGNQREYQKGAIAIENIRAPVLLLSSKGDRVWPSTYMSEQLVARARAANPNARITLESYADAGHVITQPPFTPTTTVFAQNGGTAEGNALARQKSWKKVLDFIAAVQRGN